MTIGLGNKTARQGGTALETRLRGVGAARRASEKGVRGILKSTTDNSRD